MHPAPNNAVNSIFRVFGIMRSRFWFGRLYLNRYVINPKSLQGNPPNLAKASMRDPGSFFHSIPTQGEMRPRPSVAIDATIQLHHCECDFRFCIKSTAHWTSVRNFEHIEKRNETDEDYKPMTISDLKPTVLDSLIVVINCYMIRLLVYCTR